MVHRQRQLLIHGDTLAWRLRVAGLRLPSARRAPRSRSGGWSLCCRPAPATFSPSPLPHHNHTHAHTPPARDASWVLGTGLHSPERASGTWSAHAQC